VARDRAFGGEQVQEQEAEAENEVEQMQEVEEEQVEEEEPAAFVKKSYKRDDEVLVPWPLTALGSSGLELAQPAPDAKAESDGAAAAQRDVSDGPLGFYPLNQFGVSPKLVPGSIEPLRFPDSMLVSKNYYKPKVMGVGWE
jgi:hypothetical protein